MGEMALSRNSLAWFNVSFSAKKYYTFIPLTFFFYLCMTEKSIKCQKRSPKKKLILLKIKFYHNTLTFFFCLWLNWLKSSHSTIQLILCNTKFLWIVKCATFTSWINFTFKVTHVNKNEALQCHILHINNLLLCYFILRLIFPVIF